MSKYVASASIVCFLVLAVSGITRAAELDHPLFRAIRQRDAGRLEQLLRQGTPVSIRAADGTTPLMIAALHGSANSMQVLLERGADPNAVNERGVTPLMWAVSDVAKVQLLLGHGADANARSAQGNTPLLIAASSPTAAAAVKLLLAGGADETARNRRGNSCLSNAINAGNLESLQLLLTFADEHQSVEKLVGDDASSLLQQAAQYGTVEMMALLCDRLSAIHGGKLTETGQSLNLALLTQNTEVALLLLDLGADTGKRRQPGNVPSSVLAAYSETDDNRVLKAMLAHGLDMTQENEFGETALTWARRRGHPSLIESLVAAGTPDKLEEIPAIPHRNIKLHAGNLQQLLKAAVVKSIQLLQHSSDGFLEERKTCVSCHHQNLPSVAIGWARDRGLPIDVESVDRMIRRQTEAFGQRQAFVERCYQIDRPAPVPPRFFGYGLWGLSALGYPAYSDTEASVWYLAATQRPDGSWTSGSLRPPMGDGDFTATALCVQTLQLYPLAGRADDFREQLDLATQWLSETAPRHHQERVYQLLGLGWAGRSPSDLQHLVADLLQTQRSDGGWSQLPKLTSDAWATGQTLVALHIAGGVPTDSPAYQRGLQFLLNTQFDDGSWFVKSRTFPFQPPFESGFPFGRDQWISAPATAWAAMAMTLAVEPAAASLPSTIGGIAVANASANKTTQQSALSASDNQTKNQVVFTRDIQPILERSCVGCHSGQEPQGTLDMTELAPLLRGGETGTAAVVPGLSDASLMFIAAAGLSDDLHMPPKDEHEKYPPLSTQELDKLKSWLDAGAAWPKDLKLKRKSY